MYGNRKRGRPKTRISDNIKEISGRVLWICFDWHRTEGNGEPRQFSYELSVHDDDDFYETSHIGLSAYDATPESTSAFLCKAFQLDIRKQQNITYGRPSPPPRSPIDSRPNGTRLNIRNRYG